MKNIKRAVIYITTVILSIFVGFVGMYALLYFYPQSIVTLVSKNEVTLTDKGISDGVGNIYDAVVVVETYTNDTLTGTGTGFVYDKDDDNGYIMTNHHVIESGNAIKIIYSNDTVANATLVDSDEYADIAVLKVDKNSILSIATLGSYENSKVGDTVFTIGAPMGKDYKGTVTRGIVSGRDRLVSVSTNNGISDWIMKVMQTDAAINPGNSGGPLCNINGEVIGITSMKIVQSSVEGIGFAIPIEDAKEIAKSLLSGGVERPYIGIEMTGVSDTYSLMRSGISLDSSVKSGVVIVSVVDDSPARKSGLEKGDIIVKVGDYDVSNVAEFRYHLYKYKVGDTIDIKVIRSNDTKTMKVKLGKSS